PLDGAALGLTSRAEIARPNTHSPSYATRGPMDALERVTQRVTRQGHPDAAGTPIQLLTLEEFFDGNTVVGSIGCNLDPAPTPVEFEHMLRALLERPEIVEIRVQITMFDDPAWPFSDTVWLMTSAKLQDILIWFPEELFPDSITEGW